MKMNVLALHVTRILTLQELTKGYKAYVGRQLLTKLLLLAPVLVGVTAYAQSNPIKPDEADKVVVNPSRFKAGYQTPIKGWIIREGDTLLVGKASGPAQQFAFIYETPNAVATEYADGHAFYKYMSPVNGGKRAVVGSLAQAGVLRYFFKMCASLAMAGVTYCADLDNAIKSGEILPPAQFR